MCPSVQGSAAVEEIPYTGSPSSSRTNWRPSSSRYTGRVVLLVTEEAADLHHLAALAPVDGINPFHIFWLFHRLDVQVHYNRLTVTSNKYAFQHIVLAGVDFLVRHKGRHINEIARPGFRREFKPLAPAHGARPFTT